MPAIALKGKKKAVMAPEEEMQEEEMREGSEEEEPMEVKDTMKSAKKKKGIQDGESCNCKHNKGRKKMDSLTAGMFRNDATSKKCGGGYISANKKCNKGSSSYAQEANIKKQEEEAYAKKPKSFARKAAGTLLKANAVLGAAGGVINAGLAASQGNFIGAAGHLASAKGYHEGFKAAKRGKLGRSFGIQTASGAASTLSSYQGLYHAQRRYKKRDSETYAKGFNVDYSRL